MYVLAKILAIITRHDRYFPTFNWEEKNWTHNTFRAFEYTFGRRVEVRKESKAYANRDINGHNRYEIKLFSLEAITRHFEERVRAKMRVKYRYRMVVPVLQTSSGFRIPSSPYLLAIALDTSNKASVNSTSTTVTLLYTTTGANPWMGAGAAINVSGDVITDFTYNSASATLLGKGGNTAGQWGYYFYKFNPSTGANNAVLTRSNSTSDTFGFGLETFSGVPSTVLDSSNTGTYAGGATTCTISTTVVAANCWLAGYMIKNRTPSAGAQTTIRQTGCAGFADDTLYDSNGTVGTGSQAQTLTSIAEPAGGANSPMFVVSLNPVGAAVDTIVTHNFSLLGVGQ